VSSRVKQKAKQNPPPSAEIIDLGSDDDLPVACTKRKAVDRSGSSSDVEVVEAVTHQANDASSSGKKVKMDLGSEFDLFSARGLFPFPQDSSLLFSEFGKPKLLIPADEDVPPVAKGENVQAGGSTLLEGRHHLSALEHLSADSLASSCPQLDNSPVVLPADSTHVDCVIEIDDDWRTGDDELVRTNGAEIDGVLELTDDDEIEEVLKLEDEPSDISGDGLDQCPFCGETLTMFSSHVSSLPQSAVVLSHRFRIRICNRTSMAVTTRMLSRRIPQPHPSLLTTHLHH
jgi:hypothetical protein